MKKYLVNTTLALTIGFSTVATVPQFIAPTTVEAATTSQASATAVEAKANQLIATAKGLIGKATYSNAVYKETYPYKFSCATFLMYIFEKHGVDLATYNEDYMMKQGTQVSRSQLKKGDLLFFAGTKKGKVPNHVAMYIGNNQVIHMADSKQNIVITNLSSKPYYTDNYITARRVLPTLMAATPATAGDKVVTKAYSQKDRIKIGSTNREASLRFTSGGYIEYTYRKSGVSLGTKTLSQQMKLGKAVSKSNLQKGDLVFFGSKVGSKTPGMVGIYAGDHRLIIPTTGGVITRVMFVDYYDDRYITARRVLK